MIKRMLHVYVVYDHPSDYPNEYVVRRWLNDIPMPDLEYRSTEIHEVRKYLAMKGLTWLTRVEDDDDKILETWI